MAGAIAHELRNSVTITNGYLEAAAGQLDAADPTAARESVETARDRVQRMERIVEDLHALVRYTHDAGEPRFVDFEAAVRDAAATAAAPNSVVVEGDGAIRVAPTRFKQTVKNALRFAAYNDAATVTFRLRDDGFDVRDDGRHCAAGSSDRLFEYESAEPAADAGMSLPNVRALARIEGWSVSPNETYTDGMAYRVRGASVRSDAGTTGESPEPPMSDVERPQ
jgi:K+-sensing histidine kinase KdpD